MEFTAEFEIATSHELKIEAETAEKARDIILQMSVEELMLLIKEHTIREVRMDRVHRPDGSHLECNGETGLGLSWDGYEG